MRLVAIPTGTGRVVRDSILRSWTRSREFRVDTDHFELPYEPDIDRESLLTYTADGILADVGEQFDNEPAINWTRLVPAEIWPALVMKESGDFLASCKESAFTSAVVAACDGLDGVTDGVIADPDGCRWDPHQLVGTDTPCGAITTSTPM